MSLSRVDKWQAQYAAYVLRAGGVIAHPTEAVWGLACDPNNQQAVSTILSLKKRPIEKGLILVSGQRIHFEAFLAGFPEALQSRFFSATERPTTWLVPDPQNRVPRYIKGRFNSVALRLSDHPIIGALSASLNSPLVSTAANPAGKTPALSLIQARGYFMGRIDYLLPGKLGGYTAPSEIRDLISGQVVRS